MKARMLSRPALAPFQCEAPGHPNQKSCIEAKCPPLKSSTGATEHPPVYLFALTHTIFLFVFSLFSMT
jgi:hypothetical protein